MTAGTQVAGIGAAEGRPPSGLRGMARVGLALLSAAAWVLAAVALAARVDLVALQVERGAVGVDPQYRGVAVAAALTFGAAGYGLLLAAMQTLGRLVDRMLRREPGRFVACRLTVDVLLVAALAADLVRGVDTARLGTALPLAAAPLVAGAVFFAHCRFRRAASVATNVLAGWIVLGIGCTVLLVLGL